MKKKSGILIYPLILIAILIFISNSCKKDNGDDNTTVTDIDGNVYNTITIGTQVWMGENLKVTKYRNGEAIPYITDNIEWSGLITGAFSNYSNSAASSNSYGRLYNWYAISDSRKLCPTGWHIPTDSEWEILTIYLAGEFTAGGKLKEASTVFWQSPNTGATNETGFGALPGGFRSFTGEFLSIGENARLWSSTEAGASTAWYRSMSNLDASLTRLSNDKHLGFSVRCLKD